MDHYKKSKQKIVCPDCEGTGVLTWGNDPDSECKCHYCNGTGKRYND